MRPTESQSKQRNNVFNAVFNSLFLRCHFFMASERKRIKRIGLVLYCSVSFGGVYQYYHDHLDPYRHL